MHFPQRYIWCVDLSTMGMADDHDASYSYMQFSSFWMVRIWCDDHFEWQTRHNRGHDDFLSSITPLTCEHKNGEEGDSEIGINWKLIEKCKCTTMPHIFSYEQLLRTICHVRSRPFLADRTDRDVQLELAPGRRRARNSNLAHTRCCHAWTPEYNAEYLWHHPGEFGHPSPASSTSSVRQDVF